MSAEAVLDRLTRLYPKSIDLSLERVRRLFAALGDPQDRLPPVVHVAGTNGKGSTVAYLRAILEAAGRRVHVYTSPHLVRFNERIRIAGALIDDGALEAVLAEVERINAGAPITFFEVTTAAAFLAFARTPADYTLLEVGLGGRLDATNVVARPAACALTPISFDHMAYLGNTLAEIAGEKAGILKPGVVAAVAPQPPEALEAFERRAAAIGAMLFRHGRDWRAEPTAAGMRYAGRADFDLPVPGLPGAHQIDNAGLAIAVCENLPGFRPHRDHVAAGLERVDWPARLQRLTRGPLVALLPHGGELFLDGGHNEGCAQAIAGWAAAQRDGRALDAVFGLLSTKPPAPILARLAPHLRRVRTIAIPDEPLALPAEALAEAARAAGIADAHPAQNVAAAIADLAAQADAPPRILIFGSLYLAGRILRDNG